MSRIYTVPYTGTVTNAGGNADLLILLPGDDKPLRLRGWSIGQLSEVGDAAEEGLSISLIHMTATVTDGNGTDVTPTKRDSADATDGFTAECNGATVATTSGTTTNLEEYAWNIRNSPWDWWYPDERFAPIAKQGEALILRMNTTPADDFTISMTFWVEEM